MIEYFYSSHSGYAYLGSAALKRIADAAGMRIAHRPFDLRRVVRAAKGPGFSGFSDAYRAYFFGTEIDRWAAFRGVEIMESTPTHHDNGIALSGGFLIAAAEAGADIDTLSHAVLTAHWRDDADLDDRATLARIAAACGLDGEALVTQADSAPIQAIYEANTDEAIARGLFGSPTYLLDGEMFYGQDRLDFLARALGVSRETFEEG